MPALLRKYNAYKNLNTEKNKRNLSQLHFESMASKKSKQIVLAIIMAGLLQNSSASIYNVSCLTKANYQPTAMITSSINCDTWYAYQSGNGQMLASINWATVTPANIEALGEVNGATVVSQFDSWSATCCVRIH